MDLMQLIASVPGVGPYLPYITLAIAVCALVATALPPPTDASAGWYRAVYQLVNLIAANKGHAANATAPSKGA